MPMRSEISGLNFFSENLVKYRKLMGYTQKELADILGINRTTYTKYETGVSEPSVGMILAIVDALKIDVNTLFYDGSPLANVGDGVMFLSGEERSMLLSLREMQDSDRQKTMSGISRTVKKKRAEAVKDEIK